MAQKAIRESDGKRMLARLLPQYFDGGAEAAAAAGDGLSSRAALVALPESGGAIDWDATAVAAPWVLSERLVVKPDQLIKRRGKGGLLLLNADWAGVRAWVDARAGTDVTVDGVTGRLTHFIVEPFVPHAQTDEYYVCIQSEGA